MTGRVYLVGAGPGDPRLLTARALELIASADVIIYDRLIPESALDGVRAEAELLFAGKRGGGEQVPQEQTEALLVRRAREGKRVVRLKGGDPFVFGRGGEEALTLRDAGVPFEVVPGVTAGVAALAYAGIPVTHRGLSTAVAFVTGRTGEDGELDWPALAAFPGTLVFYMGVQRLARISASLIEAGRDAAEPAAVVEAGTLRAPAYRQRHARDDRRARRARRGRLAVDHRRRRGRGALRAAGVAAREPARRADGRRHARTDAGQRPGWAPARARRERCAGAGRAHATAAGAGARAGAV